MKAWDKIKEFVTKHKKKIVITTAVIGGIAVCAIGGKKMSAKKMAKLKDEVVELAIKAEAENKMNIENLAPNWDVGSLTEIAEGIDGSLELTVNNLKPEDMGKLGENIARCKGVADDNVVSAFMYVFK